MFLKAPSLILLKSIPVISIYNYKSFINDDATTWLLKLSINYFNLILNFKQIKIKQLKLTFISYIIFILSSSLHGIIKIKFSFLY